MKAEEIYRQREQWFQDRVGKTVYRNKGTCTCAVCVSVEKNGLIISDSMHATYLHDMEGCSAADGHPIKYFDTMEEVTSFERKKKYGQSEFTCDKAKVIEILEYHQQTCPESGHPMEKGYKKIKAFLETFPDQFSYYSFCSKLQELIRPGGNGKLIDMGDRFKAGFLERMKRYRYGMDYKDLNAKIVRNRTPKVKKLIRDDNGNLIPNPKYQEQL